MLFKDIVGHQAIKQKLIAIINSERISHAQLFLGKNTPQARSLPSLQEQPILLTGRSAIYLLQTQQATAYSDR